MASTKLKRGRVSKWKGWIHWGLNIRLLRTDAMGLRKCGVLLRGFGRRWFKKRVKLV